jgi:hypothetical protein
MKRVAIVQSNYIPWKGYFDLIAHVDEFILYDEVQYTRRDWRNRNKIKTPQGLQWLTVPVQVKGRYKQPICETVIDGSDWAGKHWRALHSNHARAKHFDDTAEWLAPLYEAAGQDRLLSTMNRRFLQAVCARLGITTKITDSRDYKAEGDASEYLCRLTMAAGGDCYVSGPAARAYLREEVFARNGVGLRWFDYAGFAEYPQLWGGFEHGVSILDLLFNCGPDATDYLRHTGRIQDT